jgi:hypothetical protein
VNLFFYGTLMDADVREIVCGRPLDVVEPAIAQGFRRVHVAGRHYPMLLPHASGWVDGTLVTGVDPEAVHRLQVYEGWEYALHPIKVRTNSGHIVMAHVFLCPPGIRPDPRHWRLDTWRLRHKRTFLPKAQALMERALKRRGGGVAGRIPRPGLAPRRRPVI